MIEKVIIEAGIQLYHIGCMTIISVERCNMA